MPPLILVNDISVEFLESLAAEYLEENGTPITADVLRELGFDVTVYGGISEADVYFSN